MEEAVVHNYELLIAAGTIIFNAGLTLGAFRSVVKKQEEGEANRKVMWEKMDKLAQREARHYRGLLVVLTQLAGTIPQGNPRPNDTLIQLRQMAEEHDNGGED